MTRVTPELIASLRVAGEAATKGPWATEERNDGKEARVVISGGCIALLERYDYRNLDPYSLPAGNDAAFIAIARNHWGELLDEIEGLRRDLTETQNSVVELAEEIEWLRGNKKVSRD